VLLTHVKIIRYKILHELYNTNVNAGGREFKQEFYSSYFNSLVISHYFSPMQSRRKLSGLSAGRVGMGREVQSKSATRCFSTLASAGACEAGKKGGKARLTGRRAI
jgi:hypothetical protein